ncbi:MAG TPA: type II secretion system protein [Candidatus Pacearchaeota archaeon]|jgi:type II secretory pathway pseudopilin PulG|nr:type II secretion system protein [Candidatus Pacearchaeota archaeon]HRR94893.1 type II secretion system protein [Candidatus Paceibacterota bacterium]HPC30649.1 type II secretion system protein [Candidatus Pacearchaeota archaeon]HQG09271.1 type II secretion system protein [Candidatus Pacearchaeota archaeon]HQH20312.1 type II secretion system protein [Candidatus Pacearchaeota archaeon]
MRNKFFNKGIIQLNKLRNRNVEIEAGFTLIELVTVVSVIIILSSLVFGNYQSSRDTLALDRAAQRLSQDLRRASELSLSNYQETQGSQAIGVYFNINNPLQYILFSERNTLVDHIRSAGDVDLETIKIEEGIKICSIKKGSTVTSPLSIEFAPPMPNVYLAGDANTTDDVSIVLAPVSETNCTAPAKSKIVKINKIGRIDFGN